MRKLLQLTLFLLVGGLLSCAQESKHMALLSPSEFDSKLKSKTDPQLIDVRTPEEFEQGHLTSARNVDFNESDFEKKIEGLDKKKPVFVYCYVGGRSGQAASLLLKKGFSEIYDLKGGYKKWVEEKKPTEGTQMVADHSGMTVEGFEKVLASYDWVLVDFNAPWCPPCRKMAPYMEKLESKFDGKLHLLTLNADENKIMTQHLTVDELPTLILFNKKNRTFTHIGYIPENDLISNIKAAMKK
jgi:thioredoxin